MSVKPFIRVLIVRVLDDDFVERSPAAPVHHEARVHYAVGQEPVVLGGVVVAAVLQDGLGGGQAAVVVQEAVEAVNGGVAI